MRSLIPAGLAAAIVTSAALAAPVIAQSAKPPAQKAEQKAMPTTAAGYVAMAQQSDLLEIESSKMALQRAQRPSVKSFATMMVNDHDKAMSKMTSAVQRAGMQTSKPQLDAQHAMKLSDLQKTSTTAFDRAYVTMQVEGHETALRLHQTYARSGDNPALKAAAAEMVPAIEKHLMEVKQLSAEVGQATQPAR